MISMSQSSGHRPPGALTDVTGNSLAFSKCPCEPLAAMKFSFSSALILLLAAVSAPIKAAPTQAGTIEVLSVTGSVVDAKSKPVKAGQTLSTGDSVITGDESTATLLFSNGTKVVVEPKTDFGVDRFLQDPFDPAGKDLKALPKEPTVSKTQMAVQKGSIVADVAKLNSGSSMEVKTPLGTAGIRGTKFNIIVTQEGEGFRVTLKVLEGKVEFEKLNGQKITVSPSVDRQEITLTVKNLKEAQQGLEAVSESANLSSADAAALQQALSDAFGANTSDTGSGFGGDQGAANVGTLNNGGGGGGGGGSQNSPNQPKPYNNN